MSKGYMAAVEALGDVILSMKNDLSYKEFELERKNKELEKLKIKLSSIEKYIEYYEKE